jgi:ATP-dependent phosphofructokinase / diphosphate-dependent phosphofructokinase
MPSTDIRRIAINTGGGDAPGLNAVIRAVTLAAWHRGWDVLGIREGYNGLFLPELYPNGNGLVRLTPESVRGITHLGGTILGTTNVGNPIRFPTRLDDGTVVERDRSGDLVAAFRRERIDALVAIGGDGSLAIASVLAAKGLRVVGVPKTIDNDLDGTVITFGFDTAVSFATECLDRLHSTAESHRRVMVVEMMGRYAGWIALNAGISGSADAVLIPEIPYDLRVVADLIREREDRGRGYTLVVVAEGARPVGGEASVIETRMGAMERLGGAGARVAHEIEELTGKETRFVVLGHLLRGGSPTTFDRLLSLRFGAAAVRCLADGHSGVMVALDPPRVRYVPLAEVTHRRKVVALDCDTILTARELGVCLGDPPTGSEPGAHAGASSTAEALASR